jgi:hypothetical protein
MKVMDFLGRHFACAGKISLVIAAICDVATAQIIEKSRI